ncbi:protein Wnt-1-like [Watersipora subatra]|uniref:protein Wnt-1-like n=1 Tax=Watersipora subatra TaxID=2589382 RepID=UPI00355B10F2
MVYFSIINIFILLVSLQSFTNARKNILRGTRWWTLAQDYQSPQTYLETNEVSSGMMNDYNSVEYNSVNTQKLTKKQRKLVEKNSGSLEAVAQGALQAIKECQYQFRTRRWNCSTTEANIGGSIFGRILDIGCRETAFIYAITSAGVAHAVGRACSEGRIHTCSCDYRMEQPTGEDWKWGGCSDNFKFGYKFSKQFIDSIEQGEDLRYMVNKQNNEAGRRHVVSETTQQCKCHGMSGSCTMRTCWMRMPSFRQVGELLKEKFDGASKVYAGNDWDSGANKVSSNSNRPSRSSNGRSVSSNRIRDNALAKPENHAKKSKKNKFNFIPVDESHKTPTRKDMVYFEDSPDFCSSSSENKYNFGGTSGRECNETSLGIDGCSLMCCQRGYRTEKYIAQTRCSCIFKWCCEVECQVCPEERVRHICN